MILTTRGSSSGFWLRQLMRLELPPKDPAAEENIAVDWVTNNWREDRDTRAAVAVLARLGMTHFDWDLGLFVVLEDEWNGRWGRLEPDLKADAELQLDFLLHRDG
jgi:hypothetical protein